MPYYLKLGKVPDKRHTVFRQPNGSLYHEELVGTEGFSGLSSLVYHSNPPTQVKSHGAPYSVRSEVAIRDNLQARSYKGFELPHHDEYLASRKSLFVNADLSIGLSAPRQGPGGEKAGGYFFKNADADELIFVHKGSGVLRSMYGRIEFSYGDYIVIPRGTVYDMQFANADNRLLVIESYSPIGFPKRYVNEQGQFLEHAPFCERDIKVPEQLECHSELGSFTINIKKRGLVYPYVYSAHPFDLIGWDGCHYPFAISIHDFEPITGRIHMPPPIHQQFEAKNFVVCSFVPRLYDYHPEAIPVPYYHSNIDSDEVLYYVDGEFMSRKNVQKGQLTLHPAGLPHGPHPGAVERSLGKKETKELAVMIDPFNPLSITADAPPLEVADYSKSWLEDTSGQ